MLDTYAEVLSRYGVDSSIAAERPYRCWLGTEWGDYTGPVQALTFDESHVVATSFLAERRLA